MPTTSLIIDTADGQCPATLHTQDNDAALPAVIMYPDAGGARPAIQEMATTLSGFGYTVLLPDVYYRHGPWQPFDMSAAWTDPVERQRMLTMAKSLTPDIIARDGDAFTDSLIRHPHTFGARVGVCGYCGGGRGAFILAGRLADRIAAVGAIHPGGLVTDGPESPHLLSSRISGAVYIGAAHNDPHLPTNTQRPSSSHWRTPPLNMKSTSTAHHTDSLSPTAPTTTPTPPINTGRRSRSSFAKQFPQKVHAAREGYPLKTSEGPKSRALRACGRPAANGPGRRSCRSTTSSWRWATAGLRGARRAAHSGPTC